MLKSEPVQENFLEKKLDERRRQNAFRQLRVPDGKTDFCSNDYLGIATRGLIERGLGTDDRASGAEDPGGGGGDLRLSSGEDDRDAGSGDSDPGSGDPGLAGRALRHGSGGSRLLAGNYPLIEATEKELAVFHAAPAGLIFNSGYDANLGLLSCVPQRGDTVLYDYLSHASIRDGIRLSFAQSHSFLHNDCHDLEKKLQAVGGVQGVGGMQGAAGEIFVVTESVFSMDGDQAPLVEMAELCRQHGAHLIVDEAHATGVIGKKGEGLVQELGLHGDCFARVHTFGKAVGCHGAIVLGSAPLRDYLINFSRAFIYTTALPATSVQAIRAAYALLPKMESERQHLRALITHFQQAVFGFERLNSATPIQVVMVPGNEAVKELAARLQGKGLDVRPILYPTVPKGGERLRVVLHAFNTIAELDRLIAEL